MAYEWVYESRRLFVSANSVDCRWSVLGSTTATWKSYGFATVIYICHEWWTTMWIFKLHWSSAFLTEYWSSENGTSTKKDRLTPCVVQTNIWHKWETCHLKTLLTFVCLTTNLNKCITHKIPVSKCLIIHVDQDQNISIIPFLNLSAALVCSLVFLYHDGSYWDQCFSWGIVLYL